MQVEIWSDIMCPFCYIGKRKFEDALARFDGKDTVQVEWKSFQLSPDLVAQPGKNIHQFLAGHKGISLQQAKEMNDYVTDMAAKAGLVYDFDRSVVANSFDAHRFLHFAKRQGLQNEAEEKVFAAYFTEGRDVADRKTLVEIGKSIGMDGAELESALESGAMADAVEADIEEAQQLGIRGVPFFVFNRQYAVSGAQDSSVFLSALERSVEV
jgi:predicted DsbA family dithiol-disulfide isomerase